MALITNSEIIDLAIMIGAVAFIFKDVFRPPVSERYDPLTALKRGFDWEGFRFAIIVTAPAIVLHEMGHKFVAMLFGIPALFQAAYLWLGIGIVLRLLNFPFIFFVPGFVSYPAGLADPLTRSLIAFSGPAMNLILWLGSMALLPYAKTRRTKSILILSKQINMFLFIFNMLPIPPFDGSHVFGGLIQGLT